MVRILPNAGRKVHRPIGISCTPYYQGRSSEIGRIAGALRGFLGSYEIACGEGEAPFGPRGEEDHKATTGM